MSSSSESDSGALKFGCEYDDTVKEEGGAVLGGNCWLCCFFMRLLRPLTTVRGTANELVDIERCRVGLARKRFVGELMIVAALYDSKAW